MSRADEGEPTTIDLQEAVNVLGEAMAALEGLHGAQVFIDRREQTFVPEVRRTQAEVARELQRASELAAAASGLVNLEYWRFKGYGDPR